MEEKLTITTSHELKPGQESQGSLLSDGGTATSPCHTAIIFET